MRAIAGGALGLVCTILSVILLTPELRQKISLIAWDQYNSQYFLGLVTTLVTVAFVLSLAAGYAVAANVSEPSPEKSLATAGCTLVLSFIPTLCYERNFSSVTIIRVVIVALGTLLGGYLRTPQRKQVAIPALPQEHERQRHLEKSIATSHQYLRHMITNLVNWFSFFVTVNYASMGWFASSKHPNGSLVVAIATFFMFQNALGIVACLRIRRYVMAAGREIVSYEQAFRDILSNETTDAVVPAAVFARVTQLMMLALLSIIVMWILFSLLMTGVIQPDLVKDLIGMS